MPRISRFKKTARQRAQEAVDRKFPKRRRNFKRKNVKNMARARAPMVECKKRTLGVQGGYINPATYFSSFPCHSFIKNEQGLDEDQMIGTSIFSKYYSMKVKLNFPTEYPIVDNFRAQLIWGWVTSPLAYTNNVNDSATDPSRSTVKLEEIDREIVYRTEDGFNQAADQMNFRDKEKRIYKVVGKKWVKPDRRNQIGQTQGAIGYIDPDDDKLKIENTGSLPPWTHQITFTPMRKIKMTHSSDMVPPTGAAPSPFFYPNESWIPFVGLYTPNLGSYYEDGGVVPDSAKLSFQTNDCHWFTDS
ncbi:MAG: putative capsid protein [Cressdnaviricota sp.]|nr:MAG: putative capsid protein [Cressdnaviricota sp.]